MDARQIPSHDLTRLIQEYAAVAPEGPVDPVFNIYPDCNFTLVFYLSNSGYRVSVAGPFTRHLSEILDHAIEYVFVRFQPGRLPRFVDLDPTELIDTSCGPLPRLLGMEASSLCEQLFEARTLAGRKQVLEGLFRSSPRTSTWQDARCTLALDRMVSLGGQTTVTETARELGICARTLRRMFLDQVGLAPKQFLRSLRFQNALGMIRRGSGFSGLSDLAYACGYADQSHLIKEFRDLAGKLPSEFLPRRGHSAPQAQDAFSGTVPGLAV